jgi:hypothetical protein
VIFKPHGARGKSWAMKNCSFDLKKEGIRVKTCYAVVAISSENGVEGYRISSKPIVKSDMIAQLGDLAQTIGRENVTVFGDNLRMHYSKEVTG